MAKLVAVLAVLTGFALGYAFRGWYARRHPAQESPSPSQPELAQLHVPPDPPAR